MTGVPESSGLGTICENSGSRWVQGADFPRITRRLITVNDPTGHPMADSAHRPTSRATLRYIAQLTANWLIALGLPSIIILLHVWV